MSTAEPGPVDTEGVGPRPPRPVPLLLQELNLELDRFAHGFARRHGLHATDVGALGQLAQAEARGLPMTPSRLAAAVDLSAPATSALLNRLEQIGHVERSPDPDDRRRQLVSLHPAARTMASAFFGPLADALEGALDDLDDAEVAVVERFLRAAIEATRTLTEQAPEA